MAIAKHCSVTAATVALVCLLLILLPEFVLLFRPFTSKKPTSFPVKGEPSPCDRINFHERRKLRSDQLTILINGFSEARLPLLRSIVAGYSSSPAVNAVFILWGNVSTPSENLETLEFDSSGATPIYIFRQPTGSLNDRFLPHPFIRTRAVAICDDDVEIDRKSLEFSFKIWQSQPEKLVGFFARSHDLDLNQKKWIYTVHPDKFSIILTKFMLLSTAYLYDYSCRMPEKIRKVVDRWNNCEDIAMNFLVAGKTNSGPVLVEGKARDWGDSRNSAGKGLNDVGLSSREDHRKNRGICIGEFHRIWGKMPLRYSYGKVIDGVGEQGLCEKQGRLVFCDEQIG